MDTEAFVRWALDDARALEERMTVELLVEEAVWQWHVRHQTGHFEPSERRHERQRQRYLNPAYEPRYSEADLRRAAEVLAEMRSWSKTTYYRERPLRDVQALRFLTALEDVKLGGSEIADLTPLTALPRLRVLHFASTTCEDFRPLARCLHLRELSLSMGVHWPEVAGLEQLTQLENLSLAGNLLVFERGLVWPRVRRGGLNCVPLAARSVCDLPQLPVCEFLALAGVERLDGVECFPRLRNLTLTGRVRDFAPLTALQELTWFTCNAAEPLDVAPLARLPKLLFAAFITQHNFGIDHAPPRDFSPLTDAPQLRELRVTGCPPVDTEVAALNSAFAPWDDLFLAPAPRPLPPLRIVVAPVKEHPRRPDINRSPSEPELIDVGVRECEARWTGRFVTRAITRQLGTSDWGTMNTYSTSRSICLTIESFAVVEKLSEILEATRGALARLRHGYEAGFMIALKAPKPEPTPAQVQLEKQFQEEQDEAEFERNQREYQEYLERRRRYDLKKEDGQPIKQEEFAAPAPTPLPPPPWERDDDEEDSNDVDAGDVLVKKKPDAPPSWLDDDHPLADNYRLIGHLTRTEAWFYSRDQSLVAYLMGRAPDLIIPEEEPK
ncbi:MAG: hypothetical protein HYY24_04745 [Verrucomicrobia bacterium]|nr:hypothetical protein [Verrucomicrobiota bacterium]